ncbi:MAG: hypothetical protein PVSMB7_25750 [Chloroflexota bacterium]
MSRDDLLPGAFSRVHPRFYTPCISHLIIGVFIALVAAFTPIAELVKLVNIRTRADFILVALAVWRLRATQPDLPRGFRVPFVQVTSLLTATGCVLLLTKLPAVTFLRFIVWMILGLVVYFAYGRSHSQLEIGETNTGPTDADVR